MKITNKGKTERYRYFANEGKAMEKQRSIFLSFRSDCVELLVSPTVPTIGEPTVTGYRLAESLPSKRRYFLTKEVLERFLTQ